MTKSEFIAQIDAAIALDNSRTAVPGLIEAARALQGAEPLADYAPAIRMLINLGAALDRRPDVPSPGATDDERERIMPDWIVDEALRKARLAVVGVPS